MTPQRCYNGSAQISQPAIAYLLWVVRRHTIEVILVTSCAHGKVVFYLITFTKIAHVRSTGGTYERS